MDVLEPRNTPNPQTPPLTKTGALPKGLKNPAGIHRQTRAANSVLHLICALEQPHLGKDPPNTQELPQQRFVTTRECVAAQEGETGMGDSPRDLFPLTAAVILGVWHNAECICRGQLDPGKKKKRRDMFFFKKIKL